MTLELSRDVVSRSGLRTVRVHRKDSAFLYAILESLEGMVSYTTLPDAPGATHRDIELCIPKGFDQEVSAVVDGLRKKFPILEVTSC